MDCLFIGLSAALFLDNIGDLENNLHVMVMLTVIAEISFCIW